MDDARRAVVEPIGRNLRRLRNERGISLTTLARQAGLAKTTVIQIEKGQGNPSLETLWALTKSLGVEFSALFDGSHESTPDVLRLADAPVTMARRGGKALGRLILKRRALEGYAIKLEPGARTEIVSHPANAIAHLIAMDGEVRVGVDGELTDLSPGDRITFLGSRPHYYSSTGERILALLLIEYVTPLNVR